MGLMPSPYQILSLQAVFMMFWESQRVALPAQCVLKSPAALSPLLGATHQAEGFFKTAKINLVWLALVNRLY
jgi:hypothetical protein